MTNGIIAIIGAAFAVVTAAAYLLGRRHGAAAEKYRADGVVLQHNTMAWAEDLPPGIAYRVLTGGESSGTYYIYWVVEEGKPEYEKFPVKSRRPLGTTRIFRKPTGKKISDV